MFTAADSREARYLAHCACSYVPGHTIQGVRGRCLSHEGSVALTFCLRIWPACGGAYRSLGVPNGRWQQGRGEILGLHYGAYWWRHRPRSPSASSFSLVGGSLKHTSAPILRRQHTHSQMATVMTLYCRCGHKKVLEGGLTQIQTPSNP